MSQLRSFNIDFNWLNGTYAPEDTYANADAAVLADWYQKMGCNNFWTFAVSFNGHAWYDSRLSPKIKGLKGNFTHDCVIEGHKRGMSVFAYHCLGYNPVVEAEHPSWVRKYKGDMFRMIFCDEYIDWFCESIKESITAGGYDGLVIDWFRGPLHREEKWDDEEIKLYEQLMGIPFPEKISKSETAQFEKLCIERAWRKIKYAVSQTGNIPIWTNQPFDIPDDPVWNGNILLKEADFILNESPDTSLLSWLQRESGANTMIVQNLCGWANHDMSRLSHELNDKIGLFGFAAADPETCLPYDGKSCDNQTFAANQKNIAAIKSLFLKSSEK